MPGQRRKFSPQFKAEAVQMVIEGGRRTAEVAGDLGMHGGTLGNWVNAWRRGNPDPEQPLTPMEGARVGELEDENRRRRMENEFLKKPRPSSPGRRSSPTLRADRGGEGQLSDPVDVWAAGGGPVQFLPLAGPGGVADRGPAPAAGRRGAPGLR